MIDPNGSVDKLNSLSFDPIARLVKLDEKISAELEAMMYDEEGNMRRKFSQVAVASLLALQQKIANDLMRYGYKRVQETVEVTGNVSSNPLNIVLTSDSFDNLRDTDNSKEGNE